MTVKGTFHAQVHRGEKAKIRRRKYLLTKVCNANFRLNQSRNNINLSPASGTAFAKGKQSMWSRIVMWFKNLFYGKKAGVLEHSAQ